MHFKTRIILVIVFTLIFQYILAYHFHLRLDNPVWWAFTVAWIALQPFWQNPLAEWINFHISLYHETKERRRKYQFYLDKVKAGNVSIDDFETEAKKVIK